MRVRIKEKVLKKLKNSSGETITETLVSLLIIVLAMTMLAGSIVASAKVNRKVKDVSTAFSTEKLKATESGTVSITHDDSTESSIDVTVKTTDDKNNYVYYEATQTTP